MPREPEAAQSTSEFQCPRCGWRIDMAEHRYGCSGSPEFAKDEPRCHCVGYHPTFVGRCTNCGRLLT